MPWLLEPALVGWRQGSQEPVLLSLQVPPAHQVALFPVPALSLWGITATGVPTELPGGMAKPW